MSRERGVALGVGVLGAALLLGAEGRVWVHAVVPGAPLLTMARTDLVLPLTERTLAGGVTALGLVGLAGVGAVLVVRGWARVATGFALALVGLGALALCLGVVLERGTLAGQSDAVQQRVVDSTVIDVPASLTVWPVLATLGALLLTVSGTLVAVRSRRWAAPSARYNAPGEPAGRRAAADGDLWKALDADDDPTVDRRVTP